MIKKTINLTGKVLGFAFNFVIGTFKKFFSVFKL